MSQVLILAHKNHMRLFSEEIVKRRADLRESDPSVLK